MPVALLDFDSSAVTSAPQPAHTAPKTAKGAYLRGEDGAPLLDVCCGFGDILIGHADRAVDAAAYAQWAGRGHAVEWLEHELAERIADLIPCAQTVRFTDDAQAALISAVGAARMVTSRQTVLVCGPSAAREGLGTAAVERLSAAATSGAAQIVCFGDTAALTHAMSEAEHPPAAIVLALTDRSAAEPSFTRAARRLADGCGALLILDQVQTGLRLGSGGAEAMLGAAADVNVLGAGLANGYPIAALAGRRSVVQAADGLAPATGVSLAAACVVLEKLEHDGVANQLRIRGAELEAELEGLFWRTGAGSFVKVCGDPTYSFLDFSSYKGWSSAKLQALFRRESLARGVFTLGAHVMSSAHGDDEIFRLLDVYAAVFPAMMERIDGWRGEDAAASLARLRQGLAA